MPAQAGIQENPVKLTDEIWIPAFAGLKKCIYIQKS
jgi:hypothetical protein